MKHKYKFGLNLTLYELLPICLLPCFVMQSIVQSLKHEGQTTNSGSILRWLVQVVQLASQLANQLCSNNAERFRITDKQLSALSVEPTFTSAGYTNWKDATVSFAKHEKSKCQVDALFTTFYSSDNYVCVTSGKGCQLNQERTNWSNKFSFLCGATLGQLLLRHSDNLSRTLQHANISAV